MEGESIMSHPTTLHDIRTFLATHGQHVEAWSPSNKPLDALVGLLAERRDDERFWRDLSGLTRRIENERVNPSVFAGCEALGGGDVDRLLRELREAMPADSDTGPVATRSWAATLNATALAGFVLLGAMVGCDDPVQEGEGACEAAEVYDIVGEDEQEVFCELVAIIDDSSSSDWVYETLMECIPTLSEDLRSSLLDDFLEASDDELASLLEELAYSPACDDDWDDNYNDH